MFSIQIVGEYFSYGYGGWARMMGDTQCRFGNALDLADKKYKVKDTEFEHGYGWWIWMRNTPARFEKHG